MTPAVVDWPAAGTSRSRFGQGNVAKAYWRMQMTEKSPLTFLLSAGAAPQFKVIRWTPEMAEYAFNNHNTHQHQRLFRLSLAEKYRRTMEAGEWRPAWPQCVIAFSVGGVLLNGQKTIWAIWKSGITIEVCTQWNVPESDFVLYDDFQSRNLSQLARQAGLNNVADRNALTRMVMAIDHNLGMRVNPSVSDVVKYTVDNELMNAAITFAANRSAIRTSDAAMAYALYKIAVVHGFDAASSFYERVASGVNLGADDPRLHLKRFLERFAIKHWQDRVHVVIAVIKAFNAWMNGTPMLLMKVSPKEEIPEVVGASPLYNRSRSRTP
jgi:hypothetical protein